VGESAVEWPCAACVNLIIPPGDESTRRKDRRRKEIRSRLGPSTEADARLIDRRTCRQSLDTLHTIGSMEGAKGVGIWEAISREARVGSLAPLVAAIQCSRP
jgi:hypothetical protein